MKKILLALLPLSYLVLLLFQKDLSMLGDLGRHLKVGEVVVQCHCVPETNLFSYTNQDFPIVNHEWLAEIVFFLTSKWFGLRTLLVLKMILIISSVSLLYRIALQKGSVFWVTIFSMLSITILSTRFNVLPELFSYLFISLFIFVIEEYRRSKKMYLLIFLPLMELLWVNIHIYFVLGIVMYGFFLLETLLVQRKFNKKLFGIGIVLVLSTVVNPQFIKGAILPFTVFHNYGFDVEENNSPFAILRPSSTNTNIAYTLILQVFALELLVGCFIAGFFIKKNWKEIFQMGNGLTGTMLGLKFTRCMSLTGLLSFVPLVQSFTFTEESVKKNMNGLTRNIIKGCVGLVVAVVVLTHIKGLFDYHLLGFEFVPSAEKAVAFINKTGLNGKIFNNYIIGNHLIYGLYPQQQVYVDARPEAYPTAFFDQYWRMMSDPKFFNDQVDKFKINAVVFNVAIDDPAIVRPFLTRLIQDKNWVPVYGDGTVSIFVRNAEENKTLIEKYRITIP